MSEWQRVSRANPCVICSKESWCLFTDDAVICMRVESDRRKVFKDGTVAWIHRLNGEIKPLRPTPQYRPIKPQLNAKLYMEKLPHTDLSVLANGLGVSVKSLVDLGCRCSPQDNAYAFPMYDKDGNVVGIRLRNLRGDKWAVRGSKQGVFMSLTGYNRRVFITEGPTDTAAAMTLGLYAIGRPHCSGGTIEIPFICKRQNIMEAVIVSDNDGPGRKGAIELSKRLDIPTSILVLPCKDMRKYVNTGGDLETFEELVSNLAMWIHKNGKI